MGVQNSNLNQASILTSIVISTANAAKTMSSIDHFFAVGSMSQLSSNMEITVANEVQDQVYSITTNSTDKLDCQNVEYDEMKIYKCMCCFLVSAQNASFSILS